MKKWLTKVRLTYIITVIINTKRRQGGVHTFQILREKMVGENLRGESVEVAFELWMEQE